MSYVQPADVIAGETPVKASDQNTQNDALANLNSRVSGVEGGTMPNGSFEIVTAGEPDSWTVTDVLTGTHSVDSTTRGDGLKSIKCVIDASGGYVYAVNTAILPIYPGARIEVPFLFKSTAATARVRVQILWLNPAQTLDTTTDLFDSATGNPATWTKKSGAPMQAVCPSTASWYQVKIIAGEAGNSVAASVYFDSIRPYIYHGPVFVSRISKTSGTVDISGDVAAGEKATQAIFAIELTSGTSAISTMSSTGNSKTSLFLSTAPAGSSDDENTPKYLEWTLELNDSMQCTITTTLGGGAPAGTYTLCLLAYIV
jgi:hypothetical protein